MTGIDNTHKGRSGQKTKQKNRGLVTGEKESSAEITEEKGARVNG